MIRHAKATPTLSLPSRIRLLGIPHGAPRTADLKVQEAWLNVELPTIGRHVDIRGSIGSASFLGSLENVGGYLVPFDEAIADATKQKGYEAVATWLKQWIATNAAKNPTISLGNHFLINHRLCQVIR